ncbi:MAG: hypothetical protein ACREMA_13575, partial [Longimicrobiales bacterium]
TSITDPDGFQTQLAYGTGGLLATFTDARNNTSEFTYDAAGRLTRDEDAEGGFLAFTRTATATGYTVTRTGPLGVEAVYAVNNSIPDRNGRQTSDAVGLASVRTVADGETTQTTSDGTKVSVQVGDHAYGPVHSGALKSAMIETGSRSAQIQAMDETVLGSPNDAFSITGRTRTLQVNGFTTQSIFARQDSSLRTTSPEGRRSVTLLDARGRTKSQRFASILPVNSSYDARGRLAQSAFGNRQWVTTYDTLDRVTSITDPLGKVASIVYDSALGGRYIHAGRTIQYGFDRIGNLTSLAPPGRPAYRFGYNAVNLLTSMVTPDTVGTDTVRYTYDLKRQLTQVRLNSGRTIGIVYDTAGRPISTTTHRGTTTFAYHATTGNITSISGPGGMALNYTYDGALVSAISQTGAVSGTIGLAYDNFFRPTQQQINGGHGAAFNYDGDGLLVQAGALTMARDSAGLITATRLDSITSAQTYSSYGELAMQTAHNRNTL